MRLCAGVRFGEEATYDELKAENEQLHAQLDSVNEKIEDAKLKLDSLKSDINDVDNQPCHETAAEGLSDRADSVSSDLDEAQDDSQ